MLLASLPRTALIIAVAVAAGIGCTRTNPAFWGLPDAGSVVIEGIVTADASAPGTAGDATPEAGPASADVGAGPPDLSPDVTVESSDDAGRPQMGLVLPRVVLMGADAAGLYGGPGGTPQRDQCPMDEVLIGYRGSIDIRPTREGLIGYLEAMCGRLFPGGGPEARMQVSPGATLLPLGTGGGFPWMASCPPGEVIVAFSGYAGIALDSIRFHCAPLFTTAGEKVSIGTVRLLPSNGRIGRNSFQGGCPPGQVARGHQARAGEWVDAFGLVCGTPTTVR